MWAVTSSDSLSGPSFGGKPQGYPQKEIPMKIQTKLDTSMFIEHISGNQTWFAGKSLKTECTFHKR